MEKLHRPRPSSKKRGSQSQIARTERNRQARRAKHRKLHPNDLKAQNI